MIALACDAVEVKAKYQLPGIHPKSTGNRNVTLLFLGSLYLYQTAASQKRVFYPHKIYLKSIEFFVFFVLEF
jgi:hypothetical protein